jgi:nuclear pore complex protein Nup188
VLLAWATLLALAPAARIANGTPANALPESIDPAAAAARASSGDAGYGSLLSLLRLPQLKGVGGMNATLHKSVLKNLLTSSLAAFDVLPVHKLRVEELASLLDVLEELTASQPALCEQFWGGARFDGLEAPLYALLVGCRERHPADATPLLRALTALAEGPRAAECALKFLQNLPSVALPAPGEATAGAVVPLDEDGAPRSEWVDAMARWREAREAGGSAPRPPLPPGPVAAAADLASAHLPGACVPRGAAGTALARAGPPDPGARFSTRDDDDDAMRDDATAKKAALRVWGKERKERGCFRMFRISSPGPPPRTARASWWRACASCRSRACPRKAPPRRTPPSSTRHCGS